MMVIMLTLPILEMLTQIFQILLVAMMKALHGATQVYQNKESQAYISTNFTTKPNTPGRSEKNIEKLWKFQMKNISLFFRFIVWFRNETTLLVLWQPPYPSGFYTDYKVFMICKSQQWNHVNETDMSKLLLLILKQPTRCPSILKMPALQRHTCQRFVYVTSGRLLHLQP